MDRGLVPAEQPKEETTKKEVLILVIMDRGLVLPTRTPDVILTSVLILVIMDRGLVHVPQKREKTVAGES